MYKKVSLFLIAAFSFAVLGGCASLTGLMGGGGGSDNSQLEADQDVLVKTFQESITDVMKGQILLMNALDLQEEAAKLEEAAKNIAAGNSSKSDSETAMSLSANANEAIQGKLLVAGVLTDVKKESIKAGMLMFVQGNGKAVTVLGLAAAFGKAVADIIAADPKAAMFLPNQLGVGIYLASELPTYASTNGQFIVTGLEFLKSNGIDTADIEAQGDADKNAGAE